jgi:hypothetical protein
MTSHTKPCRFFTIFLQTYFSNYFDDIEDVLSDMETRLDTLLLEQDEAFKDVMTHLEEMAGKLNMDDAFVK